MKQEGRLQSLDALRGFDMLFIMGFSGFIIALCSLFPNGAECWLAETMKHVDWHGFAHHDTIFPLFLFLAGVSFPFSYAKSVSKGVSARQIYLKILRRALLLFLFGLIHNGLFKLNFADLRVCSVLGRIGIAWAVAAILYINFGRWARIAICCAILIGYWFVVAYIPAPDAAELIEKATGVATLNIDPLSIEGSIVGYVDRLITPGKLYNKGIFDPEGVLSTIPAVVSAMLGIFTGEYVRSEKYSGSRKSLVMFLGAVVMLVVGLLWALVFPINKMLWTSSFVLVVGAYSLSLFALFYYIIDVRGWQKWAFPLQVIGLNSITIYMAQKVISFKHMNKFLFGGLAGELPAEWGELLMRGGYVLICWLFLYFLYKKKVFLKV